MRPVKSAHWEGLIGWVIFSGGFRYGLLKQIYDRELIASDTQDDHPLKCAGQKMSGTGRQPWMGVDHTGGGLRSYAMVAQPHFLLFCDTHHSDSQLGAHGPTSSYAGSGGRWHFVLEQLDGPERLEAADSELTMNRERLALLSVVRGLEALEQPSQVTLVTTSRYVSRGLRYGLNTWRDSDYTWERFGEQRPVRNSDLWRRVDTALQFHGIKCRLIQAGQPSPESAVASTSLTAPDPINVPATSSLPASLAPEMFVPESMVAASALCASPLQVAKPTFPRKSAVLARDLRGATNLWQPASSSRKVENFRINWWNLAAAWIRWWRGRLQHRPAFYGT